MPHRQTKVEADTTSGVVKVTVPTQPASATPSATSVDVIPGTSIHEALVTDTPCPTAATPDDGQTERRQRQTPVQVQVQQPNAGGLSGLTYIIGNASAVTVIMVFCFLFYKDNRADQREAFHQNQEDRKMDRADAQAQTAAIVSAMNNLSASIATTNTNSAAVVTEFRNSREEDRRTQKEMLSLLRALVKEKREPPAPDPGMTNAPMPRAKADGTE